jgi:hypothetical protein
MGILAGAPFLVATLYLASQRQVNLPLQFGVLFASITLISFICFYYSDYKNYS